MTSCNENVFVPKQADKILRSAREFLSKKDYGKALSYFAYIVHTSPSFGDQIHDDFLFSLKNWGGILMKDGRLDDLVKCLKESCKIFPQSPEIANHVGSTLFQLNLLDEASAYFHLALKLNPQCSSANENLDAVANVLVERWHFRMLNDKERNQAYRNAIDRAVKSGCDRVLDIGSGTCILSMFAIQSGAKIVHACEMSKTMYDLSLDILSANKMADTVHVINKKSHDLTVPGDMPNRVSLIVTETLDCGLLGEGIIETLMHAKHELLDANKKTQIIPEGATVYGQLIQCETIRNYTKVRPFIFSHDISNVTIRGAEISSKREEPYTTEEMSCIDHMTLSDPFHIMTYDFLTPENYMSDLKRDINVSIVKPGSFDAIMVWFNLKLDQLETLSNAPGHSVCWEQAIYPCQLPHNERALKVNDNVILNGRLSSSAIHLEVASVIKNSCFVIQDGSPSTISKETSKISLEHQEPRKFSNFKFNKDIGISKASPNVNLQSQTLTSKLGDVNLDNVCNISMENSNIDLQYEELSKVSLDDVNSRSCIVCPSSKVANASKSVTLPYQDISKLNDIEFARNCNEALLDALAKLSYGKNVRKDIAGCITLISSLPAFNPLFALWCGFSSVLCISNETNFLNCLKLVAKEGDFLGTISFTNKPLESLAGSGGFAVLIVDPVEPRGQLRQGVIEDMVLAKGCVLPKDVGIVLPGKIEVWGMLIRSKSLCQKSHVISDDVTLGLNIAGFMKTFHVKSQVDVDVKSNPIDSLTDPALLLTLDFTKPHDDDSLLSLLKVTSDTHVTVSSEGHADGLMYWFKLGYTGDKIVSTGPESKCHFNQVVIMFDEKLSVVFEQDLIVRTSCQNSCIMATVLTH